jgi:hypothetical protein
MLRSMKARQAGLAALVAVAAASCGNDRTAPVPPARLDPAPARSAPSDAAGPATDPLGQASLAADIEYLTAPERKGRGSSSPEAQEVARWLARELQQAGYSITTMPIPDVEGQVNVIAIYGPRDDQAHTVVVSAHYDHLGVVDGVVHPGADDNASGVAVALAVARDLAARRDVAGRVVFLFTGAEELGLYGARAYAATPSVPLSETRAVFNLDMVGRRFFESTVDSDATLGSVGLPDDMALSDAADAAAAEAGLDLLSVSPSLVALIGEDWRSDDWVFRDLGVPAAHFSTGIHDDYHKPSDTPDRLSYPQMVRIAHFLRGLVARTAVR